MMRNVVAMVLGGGQGTRLTPLTSIRSKPAVPLGGMYRLIDIPISNCINSGVLRIFVLTQFMSVSLHRHIRRSYIFDHFSGGFVELLAAQQTMSLGTDWYQGTADAVRKNLRYADQADIDYVIILSGDQLYRMDYGELIRTHRKSGADVTISCIPVTRQAVREFGIMRLDDSGRVLGFAEKPKSDAEMDVVRTDPAWIDAQGVASRGRDCLASMGIYVFNRQVLRDVLTQTDYADFGREVFPVTINSHRVQMHLFDGYWEDIGTIRSFYDANLSLASDNPPFKLVTPEAPVYTRARFLPPSRIANASITNSLIANGCYIGEGSVIENSVVGLRTIVGAGVTIRDSIIMGADYYETDQQKEVIARSGRLPLGFGEGTSIYGAIVDKNCRTGRDVYIANEEQLNATPHDHPQCVIRDGIPVVIKNSELPHGWSVQQLTAV